jgi:hypothetical protein
MNVRNRAGFLSLNRISELVWDSESYEARAPSDNSSEDKGGFEDEPRVSHLQPESPTSTPATEKTNFQKSRVQLFVFFQCLRSRLGALALKKCSSRI